MKSKLLLIVVFFVFVIPIFSVELVHYEEKISPYTGKLAKYGYEYLDPNLSTIRYWYYGESSAVFSTKDPRALEEFANKFFKESDIKLSTKKDDEKILEKLKEKKLAEKLANNSFTQTLSYSIFNKPIKPIRQVQQEQNLGEKEPVVKVGDEPKYISTAPEDRMNKKPAKQISVGKKLTEKEPIVKNEDAKKNTKEEKEEKKEETSNKLNTSMRADIQNEFITLKKNNGDKESGNNFSITGNYSRINGTGDLTISGRLTTSFYSVSTSEGINLNLSGDVNKIFLSNEKMEIAAGTNLNCIYDGVNGKPGLGITGYISQKFFISKMLLTYGLITNFTSLGDNTIGTAGVALMYGLPIGDIMSINLETSYIKNLNDSGEVLNLGGTMSLYLSEAFGFDIGGNTVMFVDDYSSYSINFGSKYVF